MLYLLLLFEFMPVHSHFRIGYINSCWPWPWKTLKVARLRALKITLRYEITVLSESQPRSRIIDRKLEAISLHVLTTLIHWYTNIGNFLIDRQCSTLAAFSNSLIGGTAGNLIVGDIVATATG